MSRIRIPFIHAITGISGLLFGGKKHFFTIWGGPVAGQKLLMNRQMPVQALSGRREMKNLKTLLKLVQHRVVLKKNAVLIDAGAGFGLYELFFAKYLGNDCQTYAFESGGAAQDLLERNLAANRLTQTTLVKKAVSGKIGIIPFYENPLSGSSLIEEEARKQHRHTTVRNVFTTTIDIFCKRYALSPGFIRLNVAGGIDQALAGAAETIEKSRPLILATPRRAEERRALAALLEEQQYEAFSINAYEWLRTENDEEPMENLLTGSLLLCPYARKEEINYALHNRYRRDAEAIEKWLPRKKQPDGYVFN